MVSWGFTSREFAERSSFGIKFANPSDTMSARSVHRLFLFKAFQPLLVIYLHTVALETCGVEVFLPFCLVELFEYTYSFFDEHFSHSLSKKTAIYSLVSLYF